MMRIKNTIKTLITALLCSVLLSGIFSFRANADTDEAFWRQMSTTIYRDQLSGVGREVYNRLDSMCMSILLGDQTVESDTVSFEDIEVDRDLFLDVFSIFTNSNPQYFFIGDNFQFILSRGRVYSVCNYMYPEFYDGAFRSQYRNGFKQSILNSLDTIRSAAQGQRPEQLEYYTNLLLVQSLSYDENAPHFQSAGGVFESGKGVCAGYSKAFQILMRCLGVDTIMIYNDRHAWNAVNLYGYWFLIDVTNNDIGDDSLYLLYNTSLEGLNATQSGLYDIDPVISPMLPAFNYDNQPDIYRYTEPGFMSSGNLYFVVNDTPSRSECIMLEQGGRSNPSVADGFNVIASLVPIKGSPYVDDRPQISAKVNNKEAAKSIRAFVDRIYVNILDRPPEEEGASYWTRELYCFNKTGAQVSDLFLNSDEFYRRDTTTREFIEILYRTFFDRDADDSGIQYWAEQLDTGYMDRNMVADGFINSQEWADTCASYGIRSGGSGKAKISIAPGDNTKAFVERMYTTALGRASDPEGQRYWAQRLADYNVTGENVGMFFFDSEEMHNAGLSSEVFVDRLYRTFMDREADPDGKAYWLDYLNSHSRTEAVTGFTRSAEFIQNCVDARILPF